jgi:hypothetical protein
VGAAFQPRLIAQSNGQIAAGKPLPQYLTHKRLFSGLSDKTTASFSIKLIASVVCGGADL